MHHTADRTVKVSPRNIAGVVIKEIEKKFGAVTFSNGVAGGDGCYNYNTLTEGGDDGSSSAAGAAFGEDGPSDCSFYYCALASILFFPFIAYLYWLCGIYSLRLTYWAVLKPSCLLLFLSRNHITPDKVIMFDSYCRLRVGRIHRLGFRYSPNCIILKNETWHVEFLPGNW